MHWSSLSRFYSISYVPGIIVLTFSPMACTMVDRCDATPFACNQYHKASHCSMEDTFVPRNDKNLPMSWYVVAVGSSPLASCA